MSKFKTLIPVDVATIKELLPPKSFVGKINWDGEAVVIEWENDDYKTPYTYAVNWPDPTKLPDGVVKVDKTAPKTNAPLKTSAPQMHPTVSGQQTSSPSPQKAKPDDAATVKKKPGAK